MLLCPNRDGLLKRYTTTGKNGLAIAYHRCPHCRGYWLTAFSANFLSGADIEGQHPSAPFPANPHRFAPLCPECKTPLPASRTDNMPTAVAAYRCPAGHGYFFPAGELAKFKEAQTAKVTYHKLWNIPLPSVGSVLLASVAVILLAGIIATTVAIRQQQTSETQARQLLSSHATLPTASGTVFFVATTSIPATVTLHLPSANNKEIRMETTDRTTHTATVFTIPAGTHDYFFRITVNGKTVQTETFRFTAR